MSLNMVTAGRDLCLCPTENFHLTHCLGSQDKMTQLAKHFSCIANLLATTHGSIMDTLCITSVMRMLIGLEVTGQ